jgi:hypothetical protein
MDGMLPAGIIILYTVLLLIHTGIFREILPY